MKPTKEDYGPLWGFHPDTQERVRRLVSVFGTILGKPNIQVQETNDRPCTDLSTTISVNFGVESAYIDAEHEVGHIFAESDWDIVREQLGPWISQLLYKAGMPGTGATSEMYISTITKFAHGLWNAIEDIRVLEIWGQFFIGSYALQLADWRATCEENQERAQKDFSHYLMARALGVDVPGATPSFVQLDPEIDYVVGNIKKPVDSATCAALVMYLLARIPHLLPDPPSPDPTQSRQQATSTLNGLALLGAGAPADGAGGGVSAPPSAQPQTYSKDTNKVRQGNTRRSTTESTRIGNLIRSAMAAAALGAQPGPHDPLAGLTDGGASQMRRKIQEARTKYNALNAPPPQTTEEERLSSTFAHLGLSDDVVEPEAFFEDTPLEGQEALAILRSVRRTRGRVYSTSGSEVDVERAVQNLLTPDTSKHRPVFLEYEKVPGRYEVLFLIDRSGSMDGEGIASARRALTCLQDLPSAIPGLKIDVWLFSDRLVRLSSFGLPPVRCSGGTATGAVLEAAKAWAQERRNARILFLITDGEPSDVSKSQMRDLVVGIREAGITLVALVAGAYVNPAEAQEMFAGSVEVVEDYSEIPLAVLRIARDLLYPRLLEAAALGA
ncbi:hypothetical protein EBT31_10275 [bacterium]|nr:hypothetical protein [bacterium]